MKRGSLVMLVRHNPMDRDLIRPKFNTPYTVREVIRAGSFQDGLEAEVDSIMLVELVNEKTYYRGAEIYSEDPYCMDGFREVLPPMEAEIKELLEEPELVK